MKKNVCQSNDPDIRASVKAMGRAARAARRLAEATGTPLYVVQGKRVVNLNRGARRSKIVAA
jgi:hypothetical protein